MSMSMTMTVLFCSSNFALNVILSVHHQASQIFLLRIVSRNTYNSTSNVYPSSLSHTFIMDNVLNYVVSMIYIIKQKLRFQTNKDEYDMHATQLNPKIYGS